MYGNNAYIKDTFNDILVVQGSIITVTKLANNKSLLSQFYRTTRIAHKNRSILTIIARYNAVIQVVVSLLAYPETLKL